MSQDGAAERLSHSLVTGTRTCLKGRYICTIMLRKGLLVDNRRDALQSMQVKPCTAVVSEKWPEATEDH